MRKDGNNERGAFSFLSHIKIERAKRGQSAKVLFEFSRPILASLEMPAMYVKLNLLLQRGIKSKYGLALYELIADYIGLGQLTLPMSDFRRLMGVKPHQYKNTALLIRKVVKE